MNAFSDLNQWFLMEWLWGMTWGMYHVPIVIACMAILLYLRTPFNLKTAFLFSVGAAFFSVFLYMFYVFVFLVYFLGLSADWVAEPGAASLYLGIIYSALHLFFFWLISIWRSLNLQLFMRIIIMSNIIAALASYKIALIGLAV